MWLSEAVSGVPTSFTSKNHKKRAGKPALINCSEELSDFVSEVAFFSSAYMHFSNWLIFCKAAQTLARKGGQKCFI